MHSSHKWTTHTHYDNLHCQCLGNLSPCIFIIFRLKLYKCRYFLTSSHNLSSKQPEPFVVVACMCFCLFRLFSFFQLVQKEINVRVSILCWRRNSCHTHPSEVKYSLGFKLWHLQILKDNFTNTRWQSIFFGPHSLQISTFKLAKTKLNSWIRSFLH